MVTIRLVKATAECRFCDRKFHQIDGTEERALSVVRAAMDEHLAADHPEQVAQAHPAVRCPECQNGKCVNCTGQALDETTDDLVACACPQHD